MSNTSDVALNSSSKTRELTIDELDQVGGGILPLVLYAAFVAGYAIGVTAGVIYYNGW
jgi:lactobin A/cerein 7B family class IIb bacteriocin